MSEATYRKLDIAMEYLDAAMQHYVDGKSFFCAIHLAGAAAELLDMHLPDGKISIFEMAWKAERGLRAIDTGRTPSDKVVKQFLNWSKNAIKHMNDGERTITIDPMLEAWWWIEHALMAARRLALPRSDTQSRYEDHVNLNP